MYKFYLNFFGTLFLDAIASLDFKLSVSNLPFSASASTGLSELFFEAPCTSIIHFKQVISLQIRHGNRSANQQQSVLFWISIIENQMSKRKLDEVLNLIS